MAVGAVPREEARAQRLDLAFELVQCGGDCGLLIEWRSAERPNESAQVAFGTDKVGLQDVQLHDCRTDGEHLLGVPLTCREAGEDVERLDQVDQGARLRLGVGVVAALVELAVGVGPQRPHPDRGRRVRVSEQDDDVGARTGVVLDPQQCIDLGNECLVVVAVAAGAEEVAQSVSQVAEFSWLFGGQLCLL